MVASGTVALLDAAAASCSVVMPRSDGPARDVVLASAHADTLSGARMRLRVDRTKPFDRHMRVDLGRREASVAQQLLNGPEVRAALQDVGGRRVPQAVRPDVGRAGGRG